MSAASKIEQVVAEPHQMATMQDKGLVEDDEYEYAMEIPQTRLTRKRR
jgi:hypothetical protein